MSTPANPYAPPAAHVDDVHHGGGAEEAIRREHIKHEASIRSIGMLYYLGGGMACVGGFAIVAASMASQPIDIMVAGLLAFYLVFAAASFVVGRGIRALKPWARITAIVFGFIGLLGFPVGTLINGYILYLLMSPKGKRIFAPDYPAIVAATPHVKYRTSVIVWIVLGALVVVIGAIVIAGLVAR